MATPFPDNAYVEWTRQFVCQLKALMPDESTEHIDEALDRWCSYYGKLSPEETAELAAAWRLPPPDAKPHQEVGYGEK